jgi:ADP-ribose pyrophosphatase YjhB (NUDIX family)
VDAFINNEKEMFRVRSCGIILKNESVLMVSNNKDDYLYSVGGAVEVGENLEDACQREVYEETGFHYEIDRLVFIHENFFKWGKKPFHEIAFYFLMKPNKYEKFTKKSTNMTGGVEEMVWIPLSEYHLHKAYPAFFKDELKNIPHQVKHIVTYED